MYVCHPVRIMSICQTFVNNMKFAVPLHYECAVWVQKWIETLKNHRFLI